MNILRRCNLCPKNCLVDRYKKLGFCKASSKIKLAHISLHMWEEPFISGKSGSGTVFFSNCNLKCIFCQNKKIRDGYGKEITIKKFSEILLLQEKNGATNINLVTPTHYVPLIKKGIKSAKRMGLNIPIVYNTSSYENTSTIQMMDKLIDIYLADLKYYSDDLAIKYSNCKDYFKYASLAIDEMYKQVGKFIIKDDILVKGLVVRVLVLPGLIDDSKKIIKYLYNKYKNNIFISIMNQYTPLDKYKYDNLNRNLSNNEYNEVVNYAYDLGVRNAFIQEGDTCTDSFIPNFNIDSFL